MCHDVCVCMFAMQKGGRDSAALQLAVLTVSALSSPSFISLSLIDLGPSMLSGLGSSRLLIEIRRYREEAIGSDG